MPDPIPTPAETKARLRIRCIGVGQRPQGGGELWYAEFRALEEGDVILTHDGRSAFALASREAERFLPGHEYTLIMELDHAK